MKIALVAFDWTRAQFLLGLDKKLRAGGHETALFLEHFDKADHPNCRRIGWTRFRFETLEQFAPDRVVVFNGFATEVISGTAWLARRYPMRYVERGWLPQRGSIYVDAVGLGGRSSISQKDLVAESADEEIAAMATLERLRGEYDPGPRPPELPADYIFVPLQLEKDTSILYDSPEFKSMRALVSFVACAFFDFPVVYKPHPYAKEVGDMDGLRAPDGVSANALAAHARAVVGINSTSLIEALVHRQSILQLGRNVLSATEVACHGNLKNPREILSWEPATLDVAKALHTLSKIQTSQNDPSGYSLDLVAK